MLARLRRHRLLPAVIVGFLLCGAAIPTLWHGADDDPYCERPLIGSGGPDSSIASLPASDSGSEHCEICHWLRAMRSLDLQTADLRLSAPDSVFHHGTPFRVPDSAPRHSVFARGPPA